MLVRRLKNFEKSPKFRRITDVSNVVYIHQNMTCSSKYTINDEVAAGSSFDG